MSSRTTGWHLFGRDRRRGRRVWLNQVFLQDSREVRVVCGWGEGILLKRIDAELARHPLVGGYRAEGPAFIVEIIPRSNDGY